MHVILVHGWKGWPENAWFPWLERELQAKGWTTEALRLPDPDFPRRQDWSDQIRAAIQSPDTILIGHSLGCSAILFALQFYDGPPIHQVILVGGFGRNYHVPGLRIWFGDEQLQFDLIKPKAKHWTVIHSKNDKLVPYQEGEWLAEQLQANFITVNKGHMMHYEQVLELPELLESIQGL